MLSLKSKSGSADHRASRPRRRRQLLIRNRLVDLAEENGYIVAGPLGYNVSGWYGSPAIAGGFMMQAHCQGILAPIREAGIPLMLVQGDQDPVVPVANSRMWVETGRTVRCIGGSTR
jgi:hypothetical protein